MEEGYQALREGAAWLDLSGRGKIVVRGEDRTRLLHALCTNHIQDLRPGQGCYAFFLDAQGHILADAHVFCFEDRFVVDSEPETASKLYAHLDRYIIADDVTLEEATAHLATVALEGPHAAAVLKSLGAPVPAAPFAHADWGASFVARASYTGSEGFFVILPAAEKATLIEALGRAGAAAAGAGAATAVRLEQGKPRYGEDITEQHLPQETQQLHAIHFSKGCYLGQEIVERIRSRGHVNRLLVRLLFEAEAAPQRGVGVLAGGAPVGEVTSAAFSPAVGKVIALAYVRAGHAAPGTVLECAGRPARVISLTGDPRAELVQHALGD
jgi:folate-binding protein YgfZ